jgi:general secretion pathway protein D
VPVLGDIPLVGRMFRSKSSQVVKRNLVIFLTARMIRPDGRYEYMTEGEKELSEVTSLPVTQARQ